VTKSVPRILNSELVLGAHTLPRGTLVMYDYIKAAAKGGVGNLDFVFGQEPRRCVFANRIRRLMAEVAEKLQVAHLKQCVKTKTTKPRSTYCSRITDWTMMRIETLVNYAVHANGYVNVPLLVTRGLLTNTRLNKSILFDVRGTGCPFTGDKGTPFGYNTSGCDTRDLLHPDPEKVASLLMRRREFQPSAANLWAAAWIQFMIHGWVEHKTNKNGEMIKGTIVQRTTRDTQPNQPLVGR